MECTASGEDDDDDDDNDDDKQTKPGGSGMLLQRAGTHRATWLQVPAKVGFKVVFVYLPILYFFVFSITNPASCKRSIS